MFYNSFQTLIELGSTQVEPWFVTGSLQASDSLRRIRVRRGGRRRSRGPPARWIAALPPTMQHRPAHRCAVLPLARGRGTAGGHGLNLLGRSGPVPRPQRRATRMLVRVGMHGAGPVPCLTPSRPHSRVPPGPGGNRSRVSVHDEPAPRPAGRATADGGGSARRPLQCQGLPVPAPRPLLTGISFGQAHREIRPRKSKQPGRRGVGPHLPPPQCLTGRRPSKASAHRHISGTAM